VEVLFLAADLPWPADGGGKIATLRVLESMAEGRTVDLLALADPLAPPDLGPLREICRRVEYVNHPFTFGRHRVRQTTRALTSLASASPYRLAKFRSAAFASRVAAWKRDASYDLIHHDQLGVAGYLDPRLPSTLTAHNIEYLIYRRGSESARGTVRRMWAAVEQRKLASAEPALYRAFDHVFALTERDAAEARSQGAAASVFPIPVARRTTGPVRPPAAPTILTLGSMSWFGVEEGLLWFAERVFPRIQELVPGVVWDLVGPNAGSRIRALDNGTSIRLRGYLPNVAEAIDEARVVVVPLHIAGGVRIKLIELLAGGRPAISTSVGAEGLTFADGEGCFRRDDPMSFAEATATLLHDDSAWLAASAAGMEYAARAHSRPAAAAALETGIAAALEHHARRDPRR
jgi:glycosyltransferase involved in cell wall biosynthesis